MTHPTTMWGPLGLMSPTGRRLSMMRQSSSNTTSRSTLSGMKPSLMRMRRITMKTSHLAILQPKLKVFDEAYAAYLDTRKRFNDIKLARGYLSLPSRTPTPTWVRAPLQRLQALARERAQKVRDRKVSQRARARMLHDTLNAKEADPWPNTICSLHDLPWTVWSYNHQLPCALIQCLKPCQEEICTNRKHCGSPWTRNGDLSRSTWPWAMGLRDDGLWC